MREVIFVVVDVVSVVLRLVQPGGVRAVVAESVLIKHQLLILNRSRRRAPNLRILGSFDRWILFALDSAEEASSIGGRIQAVDIAEFSSRDGSAQVSAAVFAKAGKETGSEGVGRQNLFYVRPLDSSNR
jgi:hypothetical protein